MLDAGCWILPSLVGEGLGVGLMRDNWILDPGFWILDPRSLTPVYTQNLPIVNCMEIM